MRPERHRMCPVLALVVAAVLPVAARAAAPPIAHLHDLADFNGVLPLGEVRVHPDPARDEVYVCDGARVRIFNAAGMETFWFGLDPQLGSISDLAIDESGDITLLAYDFRHSDPPAYFLTRCNYRGELLGRTAITGLPAEFSRFAPNVLERRGAGFLLVSRTQMLATLIDGGGVFIKAYDLAALAGVEEAERASTEIFGFSIDAAGTMRFTVPVLFKAFAVSAEGAVSSFGRPGSAPGMFGVVSGIVGDEAGNAYIADRLHGVVMVFDKAGSFVGEFGFRGHGPGSLVRPNDLAMGAAGKLYVTQGSRRGVSVFATSPIAAPPAQGGFGEASRLAGERSNTTSSIHEPGAGSHLGDTPAVDAGRPGIGSLEESL